MTLPVVLICYKRPYHTYQVVRALAQHNVKNIVIFSDGPKTESDQHLVQETRKIIKNIDWTSPEIIENRENHGLARTVVAAVNYVLSRYDRMVLLEDDCVPKKYFFDFIDTGLTLYEENERVFGINGYTVPIQRHILKNYAYDAYFYPRIGSWGWATWRRAWQFFEPDLQHAYNTAIERNIDLAQGGFDIVESINRQLNGHQLDIWTLNWVVSVYNQGGCYLYPTVSHVDNIGFDGSGTNCGASSRFRSSQNVRPTISFPKDVQLDVGLVANYKDYLDGRSSSRVKSFFYQLPFIRSRKRFGANDKLRIVHINTHDIAGGAAKVAWRLATQQREYGHHAELLVGLRISGEHFTHALSFDVLPGMRSECEERGLQYYQFQGVHHLTQHPAVKDADIIHLHNLHGDYFNPFFLIALSKFKQIVWTLHDMHPITGHCAHSYDCERWRNGCDECPDLTIYPSVKNDATGRLLRDKRYIYNQCRLWVTTPSNWLLDKVSASVLQNQPQELIHNGIDTDLFCPLDRKVLRRKYGIDDDSFVLGIVAHGGIANSFKGGQDIVSLVERFSSGARKCVLLNIGDNNPSSHPDILSVPRVDDERELCRYYNLMDTFILASEAENCPLAVLEALASGTPVAAFAVGGVPELVRDGRDGVLAMKGDLDQLFEKVKGMMASPAYFRQSARQQALNFRQETMVQRYENLYREAICYPKSFL